MENNMNIEKIVVSLGKDNTDFYVDFDTLRDLIEAKDVETLGALRSYVDSMKDRNIDFRYKFVDSLTIIIANIDVLANDKILLKDFSRRKNLLQADKANRMYNFICDRINSISNAKKEKFNKLELLKLAIEDGDKVTIGNILVSTEPGMSHYKYLAKFINNHINSIKYDSVYYMLQSVVESGEKVTLEKFCYDVTVDLLNRISDIRNSIVKPMDLDKDILGAIKEYNLMIDANITLVCSMIRNKKYESVMSDKIKQYCTAEENCLRTLELVSYMKVSDYENIYSRVFIINKDGNTNEYIDKNIK